jgi:hypothetical protein
MLDRFSNHQINAPSSCKLSLKVLLQKETWGYAKVIHKKEKKLDKWKSVRDIKNNGYLDAHLKKKRDMNKIASAL